MTGDENSVSHIYNGAHMLDGLKVAKMDAQIRLICPDHPTAPLENGTTVIGDVTRFSRHCSVDGCHNLAYASTEEELDQNVQEMSRTFRDS